MDLMRKNQDKTEKEDHGYSLAVLCLLALQEDEDFCSSFAD